MQWFGWQIMGWALAYVCGFLLNKEYGFVVRCKWCSIMCEAWAYTFSHVIIHWRYKKTSFIEEYIGASQESVLHIVHPTRTHISVFMCLLDLFACFPYDQGSQCEGLFERGGYFIILISLEMWDYGTQRLTNVSMCPFVTRILRLWEDIDFNILMGVVITPPPSPKFTTKWKVPQKCYGNFNIVWCTFWNN